MNVLILTVSTGGGHGMASEAIKEALELRNPDTKTCIIDTLRYINPAVDRLVVGGYLSAVRNTPAIYGKLYKMSETTENIGEFSRKFNKLLSYGLCTLINEYKPSVIVCTHLFPLQMVSNLRDKGLIDVPTAVVITDFVTHAIWNHRNADAYIVAQEYMKREMMEMGIPGSIIHACGIPVLRRFLSRRDRNAVLKELGLDNRLTVLLMGGSLGYGEIFNAFTALMNCGRDMQIIAVTGTNAALKLRLEKAVKNDLSRKVRVFGYTGRISEFMDASDIIVTKPGGVTVSEALVKELPIFIISPIPGQEEKNAHFLVNNGVGVRVPDCGCIESVLHQIVDNPLRMRQLKEMARNLARPMAGDSAAEIIEKLADANPDKTKNLMLVPVTEKSF